MKFNVHGGHNAKVQGASGVLNEVVEDRKIKDALIKVLRENGHTVYDCTDDTATTQANNLKNIVSKCNAHSVDLDISIHFNAYNGKAKGVEVLACGTHPNVKDPATRICNAMSKLGFANRGFKVNKDLYVLNKTNAPAILIEVCFCDNQEDSKLYQSLGVTKIAETIASAILNKELVKKQESKSSDSTSQIGKAVNYTVKVANVDKGDVLNIRELPNADSKVKGSLKYNDPCKYTIILEQNGWGKLKSGLGWINLKYTKKS